MADQDSLIRAVRARPDDDTPRMVFADWLDDHGDDDAPPWATLIRAQCRGERLSQDVRDWVASGGLWRVTGVIPWVYSGAPSSARFVNILADSLDAHGARTLDVSAFPMDAETTMYHVQSLRGELRMVQGCAVPVTEYASLTVTYRRGFPDALALPMEWFEAYRLHRFLASTCADYLETWPVRSIIPSGRHPQDWALQLNYERYGAAWLGRQAIETEHPVAGVIPRMLHRLLAGDYPIVSSGPDVLVYRDLLSASNVLFDAGARLCQIIRDNRFPDYVRELA